MLTKIIEQEKANRRNRRRANAKHVPLRGKEKKNRMADRSTIHADMERYTHLVPGEAKVIEEQFEDFFFPLPRPVKPVLPKSLKTDNDPANLSKTFFLTYKGEKVTVKSAFWGKGGLICVLNDGRRVLQDELENLVAC